MDQISGTTGMSNLGREVVTRVRAPLVTSARSGALQRDWANAVEFVYEGCSVQPFLMSNKLVQEDWDQREFFSQFYRVWGPPDMDIVATDRVLWRGKTMDVKGPSGLFPTLQGDAHHIQFLAQEKDG